MKIEAEVVAKALEAWLDARDGDKEAMGRMRANGYSFELCRDLCIDSFNEVKRTRDAYVGVLTLAMETS